MRYSLSTDHLACFDSTTPVHVPAPAPAQRTSWRLPAKHTASSALHPSSNAPHPLEPGVSLFHFVVVHPSTCDSLGLLPLVCLRRSLNTLFVRSAQNSFARPQQLGRSCAPRHSLPAASPSCGASFTHDSSLRGPSVLHDLPSVPSSSRSRRCTVTALPP